MFWNDDELIKKRGARLHMPPPIPETNWELPKEPPNLSNAVIISFDTETKDTTLNDEGPGWARGKAHIAGVSLAARDRQGNEGAWYFPLRHEVEPEINLDPGRFLPWLSGVLDTPHVQKVGANLTYDIGNLNAENVRVSGELFDVQFAEPLLDMDAFVALEILARKYVGVGKTSDVVKEWCQAAYPNTPVKYWRGDLYRAPARLVAPYAIDDATLPLKIMDKQYPLLIEQELMTVFRMECDLIYLMIAMRFAGIKVNTEKAEQIIDELKQDISEYYKQVYYEYGYNLQSTDSRHIARLFDHVGIQYPSTNQGNPSIKKEWLSELEHPLAQIINDIREHEKFIGTFLRNYILNKNINGYLHPQFHQLRTDDGGTGIGRYSSSDPNLQNIPTRTKLGKKIRTVFEPEDGCTWHKFDQSQVHYRILAHFAVGPGAEELRQSYINNPAMDYHWKVYENVAPLMDWTLDDDELNDFRRRPIKNVNFGLLYGQSEKALRYKTAMYFGAGFTDEQAKEFFKAYFEGAPYVKPTMKAIGREVQFHGYVTTLLGRRIHFNLFEPAKRDYSEDQPPLPYEQALREYGAPLKRAYEYRGVNYKFQGSEPDIVKKGMLDAYKSGVFDYLGYPRLTVHDEIDMPIRNDLARKQEAINFLKNTMQNCIQLRVPLKVDEERGPNWGEVKKV